MLRRNPKCTLCKLHKTAEYVCLLGQGPEPCDIMVIGEAPGEREDDSGKPFVGRSGKLLETELARIGLPRKRVFITNAVSCRPPENRTPKKAEIAACKKWLDYQVAMVKPKFVLILGATALKAIGVEEGIKKLRGKPFEKDGITYLPTFHPAFILRSPDKSPVFSSDLDRFKEIVDFGGIPREKNLDFEIVDSWKKVETMLEDLRGEISFDLETTCLYPWDKEAGITSYGFGTKRKQWLFPGTGHPQCNWSLADIKKIVKQVDRKIHDCLIITHAGKYDCLWMEVHHQVHWRPDFDTMIAHYILDENTNHGLDLLASMFLGAPDYDIDLEIKQGKKGSYVKDLAPYHAADLYYTRNLKHIFKQKLSADPAVERVFNRILMPCVRMFVDVELRGFYVDFEKFGAVEKKLRRDIRIAEKKLAKFGNINWASTKQLGELLFKKLKIPVVEYTPKGSPSTSESVLLRIDHPITDALLAFRGAKQQLSFFIEGWKPYLVNHRIHPSFKLHGTVTGRLSCEHPNLQQVPRDPLIRSLITAPPGWTLVEADLSQIELRIAAELAGETKMLQAFAEGKDPHWMTCLSELARAGGEKELILKTAKRINKSVKSYSDAIDVLLEAGADIASDIDSAWKELRKKAKAVNFGYLYGMWWKKFIIYARDNYGVKVTEEQAQESRKNFFAQYNFEPWHKKQRRFANRNGYVRSLSGRKRRLPRAMDGFDSYEKQEAERQGINSPVQSFANEINLMAAIELHEKFPRSVLNIVGTVHDSILMEVKNEHVEKVVKAVHKAMERPKLFDDFEIELGVPIEAESKVGPWSKGVKLEQWLAA